MMYFEYLDMFINIYLIPVYRIINKIWSCDFEEKTNQKSIILKLELGPIQNEKLCKNDKKQ